MSGLRLPKKEETKSNPITEQKTVQHLNYKSHGGRHPTEIQLFPLELRPVLDDQEKRRSDFYKEMRSRKQQEQRRREEELKERSPPTMARRYRVPRRPRVCDESCPEIDGSRCTQGSDVYRNILGPTPDESILAGLQTVIEICGLSDVCRIESDSLNDSRLITSSSKPSTFYSQDALSLHKSSSDTSQDDSSRGRYPPDLQWYPCARRPIKRAIAPSPPCGGLCGSRNWFGTQSRDRQPPGPSKPLRDCSPPCPLRNNTPLCPVFKQPCPLGPSTLPQPRIAGDIPSTSIHCELPKCPVPLYEPLCKLECKKPLCEQRCLDQESLLKYGTATKGTVLLTPPLNAPADVFKQEYQQALRDQSVFSIGESEKSVGSSTEPTDESIRTPTKGTAKKYETAQTEIVPSRSVTNQPLEQANTVGYPTTEATVTRYATAQRETIPGFTVGHKLSRPPLTEIKLSKYESPHKEKLPEHFVTKQESLPSALSTSSEIRQFSTTEMPHTVEVMERYETSQKDLVPSGSVAQQYKLRQESTQSIQRSIPRKYDTSLKENSIKGVESTEYHLARQSFSAIKKNTKKNYEIAKRKSLPKIYKSIENIPLHDRVRKDYTPRGLLVINYQTPQEGFTAVQKNTIEKYQVVQPMSRSAIVSARDKDSLQRQNSPTNKAVVQQYQVAKSLSQSTIMTHPSDLTQSDNVSQKRNEKVVFSQKTFDKPLKMNIPYEILENPETIGTSHENEDVPDLKENKEERKPDDDTSKPGHSEQTKRNSKPDNVFRVEYSGKQPLPSNGNYRSKQEEQKRPYTKREKEPPPHAHKSRRPCERDEICCPKEKIPGKDVHICLDDCATTNRDEAGRKSCEPSKRDDPKTDQKRDLTAAGLPLQTFPHKSSEGFTPTETDNSGTYSIKRRSYSTSLSNVQQTEKMSHMQVQPHRTMDGYANYYNLSSYNIPEQVQRYEKSPSNVQQTDKMSHKQVQPHRTVDGYANYYNLSSYNIPEQVQRSEKSPSKVQQTEKMSYKQVQPHRTVDGHASYHNLSSYNIPEQVQRSEKSPSKVQQTEKMSYKQVQPHRTVDGHASYHNLSSYNIPEQVQRSEKSPSKVQQTEKMSYKQAQPQRTIDGHASYNLSSYNIPEQVQRYEKSPPKVQQTEKMSYKQVQPHRTVDGHPSYHNLSSYNIPEQVQRYEKSPPKVQQTEKMSYKQVQPHRTVDGHPSYHNLSSYNVPEQVQRYEKSPPKVQQTEKMSYKQVQPHRTVDGHPSYHNLSSYNVPEQVQRYEKSPPKVQQTEKMSYKQVQPQRTIDGHASYNLSSYNIPEQVQRYEKSPPKVQQTEKMSYKQVQPHRAIDGYANYHNLSSYNIPEQVQRYEKTPSNVQQTEKMSHRQVQPHRTMEGYANYHNLSSYNIPEQVQRYEKSHPIVEGYANYYNVSSYNIPEQVQRSEQSRPIVEGYANYYTVSSYNIPDDKHERDEKELKSEILDGSKKHEIRKNLHASLPPHAEKNDGDKGNQFHILHKAHIQPVTSKQSFHGMEGSREKPFVPEVKYQTKEGGIVRITTPQQLHNVNDKGSVHIPPSIEHQVYSETTGHAYSPQRERKAKPLTKSLYGRQPSQKSGKKERQIPVKQTSNGTQVGPPVVERMTKKIVKDEEIEKSERYTVPKDKILDRRIVKQTHAEPTSYERQITCKDIYDHIQKKAQQSDKRISVEAICLDKCCGPSAVDIPCFRQKWNKEVGDGICLKSVPDLTAQCFPLVNLPSSKIIASKCCIKDCSCPPGHCCCPCPGIGDQVFHIPS